MARKQVFTEVGSSSLKRSGGYVIEEFLTQLRGTKAIKTYTEMAENSAIIGALLFALKETMARVEWRVKPKEEKPEAEKGKEFLESVLKDMTHSWDDTMQEILTMLEYGHAPMELVYMRRDGNSIGESDDGRIGLRKIVLRAQDSISEWDFDESDGIRGMWQDRWNGPRVYIPIEKLLLFRTSMVKNNPLGRSVLRNSYRPWYFQKRMEEIEGIGVERDLAGLPVLYLPSTLMNAAKAGDANAKSALAGYETLVRQVRRDQQEGVILPGDRDPISGQPLYQFTLLAAGSRRNFDTGAIMERQSKQIVMTVLADFLLLGHEARGSFALGVSKVDLFLSAVQGLLKRVSGVLNKHMVTRLWKLNGFPVETMPTMEPDMTKQIDLTALSTFLQTLAGIGMPLLPDDDLESFLRGAAGLPERSEEGAGAGKPVKPKEEPNAQRATR